MQILGAIVTDGAGAPIALVLKQPGAEALTTTPSGHPTTMSFYSLSVELLEQILSQLHYFDICNVKLIRDPANDYLKILMSRCR